MVHKLESGDLSITSEETDPYRDIKPTADYTLRAIPQEQIVRAYDPEGRWLGEMTTGRLGALRERFDAYWERPDKPHMRGALTYRNFEWEIGDLFRRYKPGTKTPQGKKFKIQNHWATRDPVAR